MKIIKLKTFEILLCFPLFGPKALQNIEKGLIFRGSRAVKFQKIFSSLDTIMVGL